MINKELMKNILIVLLLTIAIFSAFKYFWSLKEQYDLSNALKRLKEEETTLVKEKQNLLGALEKEKALQKKLTQQNSELKDYLRASKRRLTKLFRNVRETQEAMGQLNSRYSLLKAENIALIGQEKKLKQKFSQVLQENESLKAKFNSITELKKAIGELKRQRRKRQETERKTQVGPRIVEGNHGYLIKDGKFTYPTKVKIEVIPAGPAGALAPKKE